MATGVIVVSKLVGKSVLTQLYSTYPIRFMQQETWSNFVHIQMLGFGGGLVSGDNYTVQIKLNSGANLSVRTVGSMKLYKSVTDNTAKCKTFIDLQNNSFFVFLPDSNACSPGTRYKQGTFLSMQKGASAVLVDWYSSGAQDTNIWQVRELRNEVVVEVDGVPLFIESQCLADTAYGSVSNKVGNAGTFGFILLVGPTTQETRDRLEALQQRKTYQEVQEDSLRTAQIAAHNSPTTAPKSEIITPSMVSVAMLDNSCKVLRFSMGSEEEAYLLMHEVLKPLNSHLPGCNAYADRLNGIDGNILDSLSSSHPVNLLRQHDAISKK